ncbi:MAG: hypothetical protein WCO21_03385 [bacterium]
MRKKVMDRAEINEYIKKKHKVLSVEQLAQDCSISENAVKHRARKMKLKLFRKKDIRTKLPSAQRYIITAAQNATPIHENFWLSLKNAAKYYEAELVVIPGRYKNPTSQWTQNNKDHEWWAADVVPYLCNGRVSLNERILILGDVKVPWATRSPLATLDALTKDKSGIVGHPNRALRSVAAPQHKQPKIMFTTGACTTRNYTDSRQGKIAASNHCLGALIVEIDGDVFYARQLNADKHGCFIDLDLAFTPSGVQPAQRALSLTPGDIHERWKRPDVMGATFDAKDSIMKLLQPQHLVLNDLVDFHTRNHHHKDDWLTKFGKWKTGIECVRTEIEDAIRFANEKTPDNCQATIVSSNHDRAVLRWLKEVDFRDDPVNAVFYLESALAMANSTRKEDGGISYDDPFITYAKKFAKKNVRFLECGQSFVLGRVEYGLHGDLGPNGSRGTTKNLSGIGVKVTKGHDHTAGIIDGCYSSGKSTGSLEYEGGGPSSHSNSHVVQYANGKRTIIFVINGRYCLARPKPPKK